MAQDTPVQPRPHRVTAADVAHQAGVSRSAVSRAFTPGAYLHQDKREHILKVAAELGYRPNALAAVLQGKGRSHLVAIVTGSLENFYDSEILSRLVQQLIAQGKWPVVLGGDDVPEADVMAVLGFPLDAMIVRGGSVPDEVVDHCAKLQIPMIVSGRILDHPGIDSVCCESEQGAALAVQALVEKGRRRIAYLGGQADLSSERERRAGFLSAMAAAGLAPVALTTGNYSYDGGLESTRSLLAQHPEIDGLFCANDAMALGALAVATGEMKRRVPETLSIIGFDDIALARWPSFGLTTIRNDIEETVSQMMRLLARRLDTPSAPAELVRIRPEFVPRLTH